MKNIFILWIFTSLSCFAADTNVDYAANAAMVAKEDALSMVLSEETNSMKSGVWINNSNHVITVQNGRMVSEAHLAMLNTSTNKASFWMFWPSTDLGYAINLVDGDGNIVTKTSFGKRFGRTPSKSPDNLPASNMQNLGLQIGGISPKGEISCGGSQFDPVRDISKCFEMEKPGDYKLTLIHKIYVTESRTNGVFLKPVTFSPVTVDVRVEKDVK